MKKTYFISSLFLFLMTSVLFAQQNENCMFCHAESDFYTEYDGKEISLTIDSTKLSNSVHGFLECNMCHDGYDPEMIPHNEDYNAFEDAYNCIDCHAGSDELPFDTIIEAHEKGVHYQKLGDQFDCYSCHNPHTYKMMARTNNETSEIISYDNSFCLQCHNKEEKIAEFTDRKFLTLLETHEFLPHQELHWKNARCIDCHTSIDQPGVSHLILPKEKAVKNCVECHSKDSRLAYSLYKFKKQKEKDSLGFYNSIILNNSYIIGATRNYYLNVISVVILFITLTALVIHAFLRRKSNKRN